MGAITEFIDAGYNILVAGSSDIGKFCYFSVTCLEYILAY